MIEFIVCFLAGIGAGLGTGFAGISAAAVISPMLVAFLGIPAYQAIGIALTSDVLASAASAFTYKKNNNLDIKNGFIMMISVLTFTMVGSYVGNLIPDGMLGNMAMYGTLAMGIKFIIAPVMTTKEKMLAVSARKRILQSIVYGAVIGFVCGFIGAGGGIMMLLVLTSVLGYELKTAIGTSVFIMTFTALTGSVSHFAIGGTPNWFCLAVCVVSTLTWAIVGAKIANRVNAKLLNRFVGILLTILGAAMIFVAFVF